MQTLKARELQHSEPSWNLGPHFVLLLHYQALLHFLDLKTLLKDWEAAKLLEKSICAGFQLKNDKFYLKYLFLANPFPHCDSCSLNRLIFNLNFGDTHLRSEISP